MFSVRAVEKLRTRTEEIALELLDQLEAAGDVDVDLVEAYCTLLPVTVIAEILGRADQRARAHPRRSARRPRRASTSA